MPTDSADDPALETLLLPFVSGQLNWPSDGVLFLRARDGWPLHQRPLPGLTCQQSFKPEADALRLAGLTVNDNANRQHALVLVLPPRQRDEARALLAHAIDATKPGGRVVVSVVNNEGARSSEADLAQLVGHVETLTKNKCRVFWSGPIGSTTNDAVLTAWRDFDAPRPIDAGRFVSRPGVFAWDRIDAASALLAKHLPNNLTGRAADLGCGFGYLAAELLSRAPNISAISLYEAEKRALDLARINISQFESRVAIDYHWHDVTTGLLGQYDVIVTNPPFHTQSRTDRPDVGRRFISAAADALAPGGSLWLVANRHLPYEAILTASFGNVSTVVQQDGFKIVAAVKAPAARKNTKQDRK